MELVSRDHELTAVLQRERFDAPPGDITSSRDLERWHAFRAAYHRAASLENGAPWPLQVDFELTSQCNMTCAFCLHGHETVPKRLLTRAQFERVVDEGEGYGLCSIKLNYINEPLLVRDLPDYITYAKSHGVLNVYFATNGVLLSERMACRLIDAGLSKAMVSLDATTPETFVKMRASSQFDLIVRNIETLLSVRARRGVTWPLVRVNFLKTHVNIHEAEAFVQRWTGVADAIGLQDCVGLPGVVNDLAPSDAALFRDHADFGCSFPFKMVVVDSGGHLLPCCTFSGRSMPIGHLSTHTIKQAWDTNVMRQLKDMHQRHAYRESAVCAHCVGDAAGVVIPVEAVRHGRLASPTG